MAKKNKKKDHSAEIIGEIQAIHFHYERAFDQLYADLGISNEQYNVLDILNDNEAGGMALNEIQVMLPNQTSNTTRLVNKLQLKKLLVKKADPNDQRKLMIQITPEGKSVLEKAKVLSIPINKALKKASSSVSSKTLKQELKGLRKAIENSKGL
ncbi:MAG: hypothetical protein RIC15_01250 [Vicingaceae bacterium]